MNEMMRRIGLVAALALLAGPAMAMDIGEDVGSTRDYGIVHEGGDAIGKVSKIEVAEDAAKGILIEVKWDGDAAHWVDSFTVFCPGSQVTPGVIDNTAGGPSFNPGVAISPGAGQLQLERELFVRLCQ
ncbi:hypothetical protein [Devosia sp.]|uniref:hypothetical protein n=1 Tax=Devosia sp. TaxID=1871048 RepID=UPI003266B733